MGYYIEVPMQQLGDHFNKADQLISFYGAWEVDSNPPWPAPDDKVLICVVRNPLFEAAGIIYDEKELECFADPDDLRPKRWLLMDRIKVVELNGRVAEVL